VDNVLDLTELRDAIRGALKDREFTIPGDEGRPLDRALWAEMAALGWLGLGIDEAHGGLGQGFAQLAVLHEELGRIVATAPSLATLVAVSVINANGPAEFKAALPAIAAGEVMFGVAMAWSKSVALKNERLNGAAEHVLFVGDADLFLLEIAEGFALVRADAEGVAAEDVPAIVLTRRLGRLVMRNVKPDAVIKLDATRSAAVQDQIALAIASDSIGGAHAIFERTIAYLGVREQFGRPIGSFQALKHRAAHWKVQLEAATALVRHAASAIDGGGDVSALASSAKFYASDLYAAVCEDAIQLHGGIGFTWEHPCHLFLKRAKLNQQLFGGSTEHKERVARLAFSEGALISNPDGG